MKLLNLTKMWLCRATETKEYGEYIKNWYYVKTIYVNLQQDLSELDKNTAGEIDYSTYKARTDKELNLKNGDGVSLTNKTIPDFLIKNSSAIGKTVVYTLVRYNGE